LRVSPDNYLLPKREALERTRRRNINGKDGIVPRGGRDHVPGARPEKRKNKPKAGAGERDAFPGCRKGACRDASPGIMERDEEQSL